MPRSMVGQVVERVVNRSFRRKKLHDFSDSWSEEPTEVEVSKTMQELIVEEMGRDALPIRRP